MGRKMILEKLEIGVGELMQTPLVYVSNFERFAPGDWREILSKEFVLDSELNLEYRFEEYTRVLSGMKSDAIGIVNWLNVVCDYIGEGQSYVEGKRKEISGLFDFLDAEAKRWARAGFKLEDFVMREARLSEYNRVMDLHMRLGTVLAKVTLGDLWLGELAEEVSGVIVGIEEKLKGDYVKSSEYVKMKMAHWDALAEKIRKDEMIRRRDAVEYAKGEGGVEDD